MKISKLKGVSIAVIAVLTFATACKKEKKN